MDEEKQINFECRLGFALNDGQGLEIAGGDALARVEKERLSLATATGQSLVFPFRELLEIGTGEYRLFLDLESGEKLVISRLGFKYDDFYRALNKAFHGVILADMLAGEKIKKKDVRADFVYLDEKGEKIGAGKAEVRILETALLVIPDLGNIGRFFLGNRQEVTRQDYSLTWRDDSGRQVILSRLGNQWDEFNQVLDQAMNALSLKSQDLLKELLPDIDSAVIRRLSVLLMDGRAVAKKKIEEVAPGLWPAFEERILDSPLGEEYRVLTSLGEAERTAIGFKRGLAGDLGGDYLWFLVPVYGRDPGQGGNAIALEAGNIKPQTAAAPPRPEDEDEVIESEGRATYFFRLLSRPEYAKMKDWSGMDQRFDDFIRAFNRAMQEIHFRREPIYLPEKRLAEPQYARYRYALKRLPELSLLRGLFIGRVIHKSPDQWRADVENLLQFNTRSVTDGEKWSKGG